MECNYNYKIENFSGRDVLVLEDNDTGIASLEDNLEKIVPQIIKNNDLSDNMMIVYRDGQCVWNGYEFKTDTFVSLNRQSWKSAVDKYIKIQLAKTVDILDLVSQVRQKVYGNEYCTSPDSDTIFFAKEIAKKNGIKYQEILKRMRPSGTIRCKVWDENGNIVSYEKIYNR